MSRWGAEVYRWADWLGLVFVVAIVYVIVRPGSKVGEAVEGLGRLVISMVRKATDLAPGTA
jgi:hypothetical protein